MGSRARPRVLWVIDQPHAVAGSFVGVVELAEWIDRDAFEVVVSVPEPGSSGAAFKALGLPVWGRRIVPAGRTAMYVAAVWSFFRLLRRERIGLVYFPDYARWRPAELLASRYATTPTVIHLRAPATNGIAADPSFRWARAIVGNSSATLTALRGRIPDARLHVVYNCIDFERFDAAEDHRGTLVPRDVPVVGYVGMLRPEKGIEHFLAMAAILRRSRPDIRYLVVGGPSPHLPGWEPYLHEYAAALGVADIVHFAGLRNDIPAVMRSLDVLVVPSLNEGFGRVIIEANAVGVPVVASNAAGIPEVVEDGVTGVLVPLADPDALAAAVGRILDDAAWRARVRSTAPARVRSRFSPSTQVRALEAVWRTALEP
jgi:glycosyltransferase involved in cell wall biosynthesis